MVLVSFMTYASQHLAILWFLRGRETASQGRHLAMDPARL